MKYSMLFLFLIVGLGSGVSQNNLNFGVKAGLNQSWVRFPGLVATIDSKTGLHFGVVGSLELTNKFSLLAELLYSQQGYKIGRSAFTNNESTRYVLITNLNYLNLPILANYEFLKNWSFHAGPQIGVFLSGNYKIGEIISGNGDIITLPSFGGGGIKKLDGGVSIGTGYAIGKHLFVQARYAIGVLNRSQGNSNNKDQNNVIQVSVGYKF